MFIDRFYTSLDLVKELRKIDIYVMGTLMKNQIPSDLTIAKSSREFKEMNRGDFKHHLYTYEWNGQTEKAGLVCWKDCDIVYCISNTTNTTEKDKCFRRSREGLVEIVRPKMISEYNKYMGGVDLADMKRLHCNSTIMGQNWWWLKIFFYLLDVGTSNANVLFNMSQRLGDTKMNIVEYKKELVKAILGTRIGYVPKAMTEHHPNRSDRRHRCAYCSLLGRVRRTRICCSASGCRLPLCSLGNGNSESDCFTEVHSNGALHKVVLAKYEDMKKAMNTKYNP